MSVKSAAGTAARGAFTMTKIVAVVGLIGLAVKGALHPVTREKAGQVKAAAAERVQQVQERRSNRGI